MVLTFLKPGDLMASAVVNQRWYRLASDDGLWEAIYVGKFGCPTSNVVEIPAEKYEHLGFNLATSSEPVHLVGSFRQRYIGRALAPVFCMPATREVYAVKNLDVYGSLTIDGFGATTIRHNQHWPNVEEKQPYAQFTDSNPTAIIATAITVCIDLYTTSVEGDGWVLYSSAVVSTSPTSASCEMEFEGKGGGVAGCQLWDDIAHVPTDMTELLLLRVTMQQLGGEMVTIFNSTGSALDWSGDISDGLEADGTFLAMIEVNLDLPLAASPIEGSGGGSHLGYLTSEVTIRLTPDEDALASHIAKTGDPDPSWEDLLAQPCMAVPDAISFQPCWRGPGNEEYDKPMIFDFFSRLSWAC
jgi:hypothetical protein